MVKITKIGKWTFAYLNPIYWTDEGTDFVGQTAEVWFTNKERCMSRTQCAKTSTLIQVLHKSSSSSSSLKSSSSKSSSFGRLQRDHLHQSWIKMMPYPYPCWKFIKPYYSVSNIALQCVPIVANTGAWVSECSHWGSAAKWGVCSTGFFLFVLFYLQYN